MVDWNLDLLGDPIPDGHTGPGRPPHVASDKNRQKCVLLAAMGYKAPEIAMALSIDQKTLRKHYSRELRALVAARHKVEGALLMQLATEAAKGNVSAIKDMYKRLDKAGLTDLSDRIANRGRAEKPKAEKLGKKAAAREAAGQVVGKFAPPPPPRLIN